MYAKCLALCLTHIRNLLCAGCHYCLNIFHSDEETTTMLRPMTCPKSHGFQAGFRNSIHSTFLPSVCFASGSIMMVRLVNRLILCSSAKRASSEYLVGLHCGGWVRILQNQNEPCGETTKFALHGYWENSILPFASQIIWGASVIERKHIRCLGLNSISAAS